MKYTGSHFGLLFLTSAELNPDDFLEETSFRLKMSAIFAPWEKSLTAVEIPTTEEIKNLVTSDLCTSDICNVLIKNFKGEL